MISNNLMKVLSSMKEGEIYTRLAIAVDTGIKPITIHNLLKTLINLDLIEINKISKKNPIIYNITRRGIKMQEVLYGK